MALFSKFEGIITPSHITSLKVYYVFKKYLREYATKVLIANMPKGGGAADGGGSGVASAASSASAVMGGLVSSASSSSLAMINKDKLRDFSTSGLIQNFQSLLREEGDAVRLSEDEKVLVCTFLVTSEYCLETICTTFLSV